MFNNYFFVFRGNLLTGQVRPDLLTGRLLNEVRPDRLTGRLI